MIPIRVKCIFRVLCIPNVFKHVICTVPCAYISGVFGMMHSQKGPASSIYALHELFFLANFSAACILSRRRFLPHTQLTTGLLGLLIYYDYLDT